MMMIDNVWYCCCGGCCRCWCCVGSILLIACIITFNLLFSCRFALGPPDNPQQQFFGVVFGNKTRGAGDHGGLKHVLGSRCHILSGFNVIVMEAREFRLDCTVAHDPGRYAARMVWGASGMAHILPMHTSELHKQAFRKIPSPLVGHSIWSFLEAGPAN